VDDQRGTRRRSCLDYGLLTAAGAWAWTVVAATQLGRYSLHWTKVSYTLGMGTFVGGDPFLGAFLKGGFEGLQSYVDLKAIQFHILTS